MILLTGGLGYIGSHLVISLLAKGYHVVIVDNLSNCSLGRLEAIRSILVEIESEDALGGLFFYQVDIRDRGAMESVFEQHCFDLVIHLAALKSVSESLSSPSAYLSNNVAGTTTLLAMCIEFGVNRFIFSSTAALYATSGCLPYKESSDIAPNSFYAVTKMLSEYELEILSQRFHHFKPIIMRFFNPVGSMWRDERLFDGWLGGADNLFPILRNCVLNKKPFGIFGNDYDTVDGSPERDYIHISDLVDAHIRVIEKVDSFSSGEIFNLGSGSCFSVLRVVEALNVQLGEVNGGISVFYQDRRLGDVARSVASITKAKSLIDYSPAVDLNAMISNLLDEIKILEKKN